MNDTIILNDRQQQIIDLLSRGNSPLGRDDIAIHVDASKPTIIRDLNSLEQFGLVLRIGDGPSTGYKLANTSRLLKYIDKEEYFNADPMGRDLITQDDHELFDVLENEDLINDVEKARLNSINQEFIVRRDKMPPDGMRRDIERFTIELAWKSSAIEGNTYTLLETEELIKNLRVADGKTVPETQMILNHKKALDVILTHRKDYKNIRLSDVIDIHSALVDNLGVTGGIRSQSVGITGTKYAPIDNRFQLTERMERLIDVVNKKDHPVEKALILSGMIAYLQPFMDGNKRTARLMANAVLVGNDFSALSYRAVSDIEYKKAVLLIDEQHNFYWYKKIFIDQFIDAAENYFAI